MHWAAQPIGKVWACHRTFKLHLNGAKRMGEMPWERGLVLRCTAGLAIWPALKLRWATRSQQSDGHVAKRNLCVSPLDD